MFQVHLICHLWDLLDEGVDEVLDRLQGELGLAGVCVPVVCPPVALLRARPPGAPGRIFRSRGGLFFAPQEEYYQATRCKPVVSTWLKGRSASAGLRRVADGCRKHGLAFRVVVATSAAGRMTARNPHAAAKTVFGDSWPDRLCLVNPDVRSFVVGLCRDLADNYGPTAIELTELHVGRVGRRRAGAESVAGLDLGPGGRALLELCFCESCRQLDQDGGPRQAGGLDIASAVRSAEVRLSRVLETGRAIDQTANQVLGDDPALCAHVKSQWRALTDLVQTVRKEIACELIVHAYDDSVRAAADPCPLTDGGPAPLDAILIRHGWVEQPSGEDVESVARSAVARAGPGTRAELQIPVYELCQATVPDATQVAASVLVRTLSRLAELGIASVSLDSYGQVPASALTGVKQAVRFARRVPARGGARDG